MSVSRANRVQLVLVMGLLVLLHFYLRPRLGNARVSPDFLLIALVFFAMRAGPGAGALAGFIVGVVNDALTPAAFGAGALAHTVVGYLAAWGRAVFFADNLLVNAGFVAVALWVRDLILLVASGTPTGPAAGGPHAHHSAPGAVHGGVRPAGAGGVPGVVRHQAGHMNGFDSYRVRERADVARLVLMATFVLLAGAFFRTQVIQHEKFQLRAETNRLRPISLTAPRGTILDRDGNIIAENVPGYSVKVLAPSADSLRAVIGRIGRFVPVDTAEVEEIVQRFRQARYQPAVVFGDASFETIARLEEHRAVLPGLLIQSEPKRLYPAGKAVAHLVGYVSEVTERDLEANRYPGAELGTIVGKAGLEREYDDSLRGLEGVRYMEVNARGRLVREDAGGASLQPTPGRPIRTTIDLELQRYIDSIWPAGTRGAMIAMTPGGQIRALYSAPSYDPNVFVGGISRANWRALNDDEARPLLNRAIQTRYPPASPFKLAISCHGAEAGAHRARHPHADAVPRRDAAGQPGVPLLEEGGPRLPRPDRRGRLQLRRVLLSGRSPPRAQGDPGGRGADGLSRSQRDRPGEREEPDLAFLHRLLRQALRAPALEPAGHDPELLDRAGGDHPDPDQHDEVLRGAGERGALVHAVRRAPQLPTSRWTWG